MVVIESEVSNNVQSPGKEEGNEPFVNSIKKVEDIVKSMNVRQGEGSIVL